MSPDTGPKGPSRPTVKRLFALSGNCCAFPKCSTPLIDPPTGSVIGEICHIKGEKSGAARFDASQSNEERQGFNNLLLLCNVHHKIVDDDEIAYTVNRLEQMKQNHAANIGASAQVEESAVEHFVTVSINNSTLNGSVITTHGQTGGQTAHSIKNYYDRPHSVDEPIQIEGKLEMEGGIESLSKFGCPGMRLTVCCRGNRPAKIKVARLHVGGVDIMRAMKEGFESDFGYQPVEGSTETLTVEFVPLSPPNSHEGYVLNRDDVCRFFYPLALPPTHLILRAKPEQISVNVQFFDDTERLILSGNDVQDVLRTVFQIYQKQPGHLKVPINIGVRVKSTVPPNAEMTGRLNRNFVKFAEPDQSDPPAPPDSTTK